MVSRITLKLLLDYLITGKSPIIDISPPTSDGSFETWWANYSSLAGSCNPFDRAVIGGFLSDRVAFAFAGGYQSAIHHMIPSLSPTKLASIAITEEGGAHPRAIKAIISPEIDDVDNFRVSGRKKWITLAAEADLLIVAASVGFTIDGRNEIRLACIPSAADGMTITPMQTVEIVPEISHCEVILDNVQVSAKDMLPGDGYTRYIRPFRTIEDIHVSAGICGYLSRISQQFNWDITIRGELFSIIASLRALSEGDPEAPSLHVALGGALSIEQKILNSLQSSWALVDLDTRDRWNRDSIVLGVAGKVREARLAKAWENLTERGIKNPSENG
ncbi:MAG TPA: acyl-CoA dehydrogenase family protein [Candidatus Lokiarchaeia archaeon]|nr:acyl-CoA dehydrogenase family protein [Candidatus Lokiarchaeia archaeon]